MAVTAVMAVDDGYGERRVVSVAACIAKKKKGTLVRDGGVFCRLVGGEIVSCLAGGAGMAGGKGRGARGRGEEATSRRWKKYASSPNLIYPELACGW